jgi:hypothetical protein
VNPEWSPEEDIDETGYAKARLPSRTYVSKSFPLKRSNSSDDGSPARFICKVFDPETESTLELDGEGYTIRETPAGRYQIKLLVAREAGNIKELWIQRVPTATSSANVTNLLNLKQPDIGRLVELLKALDAIPIEGETTVRVDDSLVQDLIADPNALTKVYKEDPSRFRQLIQDDVAARDVVAQASRRDAVLKFRQMLDDETFFNSLVQTEGKGSKERVWQLLFEQNPWMLGVSFSNQLLTSWDHHKLEQVVDGFDISGPGKRTDALMRTAGRVRSMVFLEFKTHRTDLLGAEYRSGCWPASTELMGGLSQIQGTVHRAVTAIGERLQSIDDGGCDVPGDFTYLIRPPSMLIVGTLTQLQSNAGGDHQDKIRSFELFRRSIVDTEIITFDELYAKAKFIVDGAP